MADLIDREAAMNILHECGGDEIYPPDMVKMRGRMNKLPSADAVEIVRCKDCVRRNDPGECPMCFLSGGDWDDYTFDDGYCDRGERKGGEHR